MRKKLFAALIVAAGMMFAGYNIVQSQNSKNSLSDLLTANVEALARGEIPEVEITCGAISGQCWAAYGDCYVSWVIKYEACRFTGYTYNSCSSPCD
ncbi:NVEALA domain-containing protein [Bacteroides sp.]